MNRALFLLSRAVSGGIAARHGCSAVEESVALCLERCDGGTQLADGGEQSAQAHCVSAP